MADASRTIDLIFNGVDKTGAAVQSAINNTKGFAAGVESASAPIANFATSVLKYEAALLGAGAATAAFAINVAGDFDGAFRELTTLIDAPVESLDNFRTAILDYSSGSTQSLDDVTSALYTALSAGVEYTDALEFLTSAEQLAVAGRASLADSTNVLISSLNAYNLSTEQAGRFSDVLFGTVKEGQVTLPQLAQGFSQLTQSASTLGIPVEELGAAIATLTKAGVPAEKAFTQLRAVLSNLVKPSKQASDEADRLGIGFDAATVKSDGFANTLANIATATGGSEESLGKLFGSVEALGSVFTLTGVNAQSFEQILLNLQNAAGNTAVAYEKFAGSFELQNQQVANAFKGFLINVGTPLLDEYGSLTDALAGVFQALGGATDSGGFGDLISFAESELQALADLVGTIAENLPAALAQADFSGFTEGVRVVSDAFAELFSNVDITSVEGLKAGIELLGAGFLGLSNFSAGVVESFGPLVDLLQDVASGVAGATDAFRDAGNIGGIAIQVNAAAGALASAIPVFEAAAVILAGNGAVTLAKSAKGAALALGGAGGLVPSLTLLAGAGAAGFGIGTLANEISALTTGETLTEKLGSWLDQFSGLNEQAQSLTESLNIPQNAGIAALDDELRKLNSEIEKSGELTFNFSTGLSEVASNDGVGTLNDLSVYWDEIQKATAEAEKATDAYNKKVAETDPSIIIKQIESATAITTASIEADAKKVTAAFDSIGVSVDATSKTLGELTGLLGDENISKFDKLGIKEQIEAQAELQQQTLKTQEQLTKAQIAETKARTAALRNGGATINIDGAGLQPHLEAFMFEILESLQVRVNAEGYNLLLGAG